jgi:hypothetical protein
LPTHSPSRVGIVAEIYGPQHRFLETGGAVERPQRCFKAGNHPTGSSDFRRLLAPEAAVRNHLDQGMERSDLQQLSFMGLGSKLAER